jgi:mitosis inhibitor protein kinase SWE1
LDIKPENIFLTETGLKIGDFGVAIHMSQDTRVDVEGDKVYMAPELLNGQPCFASDIFSLGLLLLEISMDIELPTEGEAWQQLRRGDLTQINFKDRSIALIEFIHRMLRSNPEVRPSANDLLQHELIISIIQRRQLNVPSQLNITTWIPSVSEPPFSYER